MEITPVRFINIKLEGDEAGHFIEIIKECIKQAVKPGFKNAFDEDEKFLLAKIARGLGMEVDEHTFIILSGDTHTEQKYNG